MHELRHLPLRQKYARVMQTACLIERLTDCHAVVGTTNSISNKLVMCHAAGSKRPPSRPSSASGPVAKQHQSAPRSQSPSPVPGT